MPPLKKKQRELMRKFQHEQVRIQLHDHIFSISLCRLKYSGYKKLVNRLVKSGRCCSNSKRISTRLENRLKRTKINYVSLCVAVKT